MINDVRKKDLEKLMLLAGVAGDKYYFNMDEIMFNQAVEERFANH